MISVESASRLIDFGGRISEKAAEAQLRGSVALHNILHRHRVAYLADEVGMGKTYVALGALALFRHFDPNFRALVIAPRENIQKKWVKELGNFVANNVRYPDLRVKAVHGVSAREAVICGNLLELVREAALNPDRDFFARLTSFSLPLGRDSRGWRTTRDQILEQVPWFSRNSFDLRQKDAFKDNYARAVCCALPVFDLVIVDEGHNLKHGLREAGSFRNRLLAFCFGHPKGRLSDPDFANYRPRAKRVLFLSATPIENDYRQLWNQLDIFNLGQVASELVGADVLDDEKKRRVQQFLIRRVTSINVNGENLTKNLYRREWRQGGIEAHDDPLEAPGERERLIVALVQKKVAERLGSEKFNNSFQIGMLASFESFMETAKVKKPGDDENAIGVFDDADQTEDVQERSGVDVVSINRLAKSYRRRFNAELPHPKMDAIVEQLAAAFETGKKALVFVRRVASVKEIQRKLERYYDTHVFDRLNSELPAPMRLKLSEIIADYRETQRRARRHRVEAAKFSPDVEEDEVEVEAVAPEEEDEGGTETFFAWFFRGEGPPNVLSGALMQKRFSSSGSVYSTFFEDNHVAWLLSAKPGDVFQKLARYLGTDAEALRTELRELATQWLPRVKKQQRRTLFLAVQRAALVLLARHPGHIREIADVVLKERYFEEAPSQRESGDGAELGEWLELPTFWTELRERESLRAKLWPGSRSQDFRQQFREQELRRELFSAMARLGNPFIDLYALALRRVGDFALRAREEESFQDLAVEFLDRLDSQRTEGQHRYTSFGELAAAAENFDLILDVNAPAVRSGPLTEAATEFGRLLRQQQPVGGMFGGINQTLVRQFRMPGYPLVLISTDLLQEGEDLHTFCSSVVHYGISWMPSSMEQRVGRVDRVSSESERRMLALRQGLQGSDMLQVYYPHLRDTVEVLQVERVLERMNLFLKLMHENLGQPDKGTGSIDIAGDIIRTRRQIEQIRKPLETAFPISEEHIAGEDRAPAVNADRAQEIISRFAGLRQKLNESIDWEEHSPTNRLIGTLRLANGRRQVFRLDLRSLEGRPLVRCVSPIAPMPARTAPEDVAALVCRLPVQLIAIPNARSQAYDLGVDGEVLLGDEEFDIVRVGGLIRRVVSNADVLEERLVEEDSPFTEIWERQLAGDSNAL